jgi:ribosomal protein L17
VGGVVGERIGERERGYVRIINGGERRREWEEKLM